MTSTGARKRGVGETTSEFRAKQGKSKRGPSLARRMTKKNAGDWATGDEWASYEKAREGAGMAGLSAGERRKRTA